jgi:hypothetical protein
MEITTRRRRALSTALALVLAIESVSAVAAVAVASRPIDTGSRHALPAASPAGGVLAAQGDDDLATRASATRAVPAVSAGRPPEEPDSPGIGPLRTTQPAAPVRARAPKPMAVTAIKGPTKSSGGSSVTSGSSGSRVYKGRNHVWIPALGINRSVSWFPCDRKRPPDNYVYRWGCAGRNNVYLMGHAHSVFKSLHNAYVGGRLRKGMKAIYADSNGKVRTYSVRWWKLTRPTTAASWAWAAQSVPSMTLQTCVGKNSEYRLMVRLVEVK